MPEDYKALLIRKAETGDTYATGTLFEQYSSEIFPEKYFSIIRYTPRREDIPNRKCEETKYPDFLFRDKKTKEPFWIECKFRSQLFSGKYVITPYQNRLEQYRECRINTNYKTFFIMGLGNQPYDPEHIYLTDLDNTQYCKMGKKYIEPFELETWKRKLGFTSLNEIISFSNKIV